MAFIYWGHWGGPGYSNGHYTTPGEIIDWQGAYADLVDKEFRNFGIMTMLTTLLKEPTPPPPKQTWTVLYIGLQLLLQTMRSRITSRRWLPAGH